jgi:hypothetical protein
MSERRTRASAPPSSRDGIAAPPIGAAQVSREGKRGSNAKGRRGRPSYEEYVKWVCEALRYDLVQLEGCTALAQLPGVQAARRRQTKTFLPIGASLRAIFDRAVADVEALAKASHTPTLRRVAIFLQIWYREHGTVGQVAEALQLSRSRVAHAVQPQALELVAKRFLDLAWNMEMPA